MAYVKTVWQDGVEGETKIDATHLNKIEDQLEFLSETKGLNVAELNTSSSNKSIASSNYVFIDSNFGVTLNVTQGDTVLILLKVGSVWNTNTGYSIGFNIEMDGSTYPDTGAREISPVNWSGNFATDGSKRVCETIPFVFKNVEPGSHTFKPLWNTFNNEVTAYIGQYGSVQLIAVEI